MGCGSSAHAAAVVTRSQLQQQQPQQQEKQQQQPQQQQQREEQQRKQQQQPQQQQPQQGQETGATDLSPRSPAAGNVSSGSGGGKAHLHKAVVAARSSSRRDSSGSSCSRCESSNGRTRPRAATVVSKAISLRGLRRLVAHLQLDDTRCAFLAGKPFSKLNMYDLKSWVVRVTRDEHQLGGEASLRRLVDVGELVDPGDVGPPDYFISHAWANSFAGLVQSIEGFLVDAAEDTRVWLDIFAVNQHDGTRQNAEDVAAIQDVVQAAKYGTLVVMGSAGEPGKPASRAWCVYEWAATLQYYGTDGLMMPLSLVERLALVHGLDISKAQCASQKDKEMILGRIGREPGGVVGFNSRLKWMLLLQPLSYKSDLRRLLERSAGTVWDWQPVRAWLQAPGLAAGPATAAPAVPSPPPQQQQQQQQPPPRVLCLMAGPGEGKSTVSAALCANTDLIKTVEGLVLAYHFVKYSDQRRLDARSAVQSLAFQLADRVRQQIDLSPYIVDAERDPQRFADVATAAEDLLLKPIQRLVATTRGKGAQAATEGVRQIVVLLDAVDEADPPPPPSQPSPAPPPQAAGEHSYGNKDSSGSSGSSGDSSGSRRGPMTRAGSSVVPLGNKVFQLLVRHLKDLPPCVRFIVTTRPDAVNGRILDSLRRAFGQEQVRVITPADLMAGSSGGLTCGPLQALSVEPSSSSSSPSPPSPQPRGGGVGRTAGRVLVYDTVVKACGLESLAVARRAARSGDPQLDDLYWAYEQVFLRALQPTAQGATATAAATASGDSFRGAVRKLLSVMLAAQEPLALSLIQSLGLRKTLESLPGYGTIFYLDEHRLYFIHKSLADWLVSGGSTLVAAPDEGQQRQSPSSSSSPSPSPSGFLSVADVVHGHRLLADRLLSSIQDCSCVSENLPSYTLKYTVRHLVACGDGGRLGALLQRFEFLAAVFSRGYGHLLLRDMQKLPEADASSTTTCLADLQRGLLARQHELVETGGTSSAIDVAVCLLGCPVRTAAFRLARERLRAAPAPAQGWRIHDVLGGPSHWTPLRMTLKGHEAGVRAVAWSPDGNTFASGGDDNTVCIWDVASAQCIGTLEGHAFSVASLAWSPDGRTLASGCEDSIIRLWDAASGLCTDMLEGHATCVSSLAWRPDGRVLASASFDDTIRLWGVAADGCGRCTASMESSGGGVRSVCWSPDGERLATASLDEHVRIWNAASGELAVVLEGHEAGVRAVAWSPDGRTLVSGADDKTVRTWHVASGECTGVLEGHKDRVSSVCWSADGRTLATASWDKTVRLWDVAAGTCAFTLQGHGAHVKVVCWGPGGKTLVSGSYDRTVRVWDTGHCRSADAVEGHEAGVRAVAWSPDGRTLVSGADDKTVRTWDVASGECTGVLERHEGPVVGVSWRTDGGALATSCGGGAAPGPSVRLWTVSSDGARCSGTLQDEGGGGAIYGVCWRPDGRWLATSGADKTVRLWDEASRQCVRRLEGHEGEVRAVAWSPDGDMVASGSDDKTVRTWDAASGECTGVLEGHRSCVTSVVWSPAGGTLASGSFDKTVRLWSTTTRQCTGLLEGHRISVVSLAWRPDGRLLASASWDETVRLWDVASCTCTGTLKGHGGAVCSLTWSPDGTTLASGSSDKTARLWKVADGSSPTEAAAVGDS